MPSSKKLGPAPLLWRIRGFQAGLDWDPFDGLYTASVARLPGIRGRGATRAEALAALDRALGKVLADSAFAESN